MRFLPPVAGLATGRVDFDGDPHMRNRPVGEVLAALRALGVRVEGDALPFAVRGEGGVAYGHQVVELGAFAEAVVVVDHTGDAVLAANVDYLLGDGARLTVVSVQDWDDKKANFELIVGRSMPDDRDPRYVGLVHGYDRKPKRRLFELLKAQGLQANQDVTFLTDGGEEVRSLTELVTPEAEHVLDWFHIAMRLTVLEQYARGVAHHDADQGARLLRELERTKWLLWHGNGHRARQHADDVRGLEMD